MVKNEGKVDRIIRAIFGIALISLAYAVLGGTVRIIFYALGAGFILTSITGFCSLYKISGINTLKK